MSVVCQWKNDNSKQVSNKRNLRNSYKTMLNNPQNYKWLSCIQSIFIETGNTYILITKSTSTQLIYTYLLNTL